MDRSVLVLAVALELAAGACAPRARPLAGAPTPARLPTAQLPAGHQRMLFRWEFRDGDVLARGDGVARVAAPDSVRLDLFLDGGLGGGYAVVIGDEIFAPGGDAIRRYLPPAPLLWASLGRLAVPHAADTTARVDGEVLRADIGSSPTWRVTFDGPRLARLERIEDGRLVESVERRGGGAVRYERPLSQRVLTLDITGTEKTSNFDAAIWRH